MCERFKDIILIRLNQTFMFSRSSCPKTIFNNIKYQFIDDKTYIIKRCNNKIGRGIRWCFTAYQQYLSDITGREGGGEEIVYNFFVT